MAAVRLGDKKSAPSSSSIFHCANGTVQFTIDPSAISRLSSINNSDDSSKVSFTVPDYLTVEESRASLLLLLNKLLLSSSSSSAAASELSNIILNTKSLSSRYEISAGNLTPLFDYSVAAVDGICALLDHSSSALATVIDAVTALSCEALKADITPFNLIDSGDGSSAKDEVAVASDFKVFFNGSKSVGKGGLVDSAISTVPAIHGIFRELCRLLHSKTHVQLSSGFRAAGSAEAMCIVVWALARSLSRLAEISSHRAKLLVDLSPNLATFVNAPCPIILSVDCLEELYSTLNKEEDYARFCHQVYGLLDQVWEIVSQEATLAFLSLEDIQSSEPHNADDRKNEKRKKKVVLGKGSTALIQFIKERFFNGSACNFSLSLYPRESGFENLVNKVKEIVESNESRRLPKLPKVLMLSI